MTNPIKPQAPLQNLHICVCCGFKKAFKSHDWEKSSDGNYGSWGSTGWVHPSDPSVQPSSFDPDSRINKVETACLSCVKASRR